MPIGATIGAAAITAGGAVAASSASKKAANKASDTAAAGSAANTALAREQYANNAARLDPYSQGGMRAGGVLSGMLGVGDPNSSVDWAAYVNANPDALEDHNLRHADQSLADYGKYHWAADGSRRDLTPFGRQSDGGALAAFDAFRNSTNYQFRVNEGQKGFAQGAFAKGYGESGAAMKGLEQYRQNIAANELGTFQDRLFQQQQTGMGAASALAGVGQNMVGNVTANNNNAASAAGNAALINGQAQGQMYGSIAGALGSVASSFGPRNTASTQPYMGVSGLGYYGG
jgi:hypothetical protein